MRSQLSRRSVAFLTVVSSVALAGSLGCGDDVATTSQPIKCGGNVTALDELLVVDSRVLESDDARNKTNGRLSFRHLVETLTPAGTDSQAFLSNWLTTFSVEQIRGLNRVIPRFRAKEVLVCPWLRMTPANECNDDCSSCKDRFFTLEDAPVRLIGLSNRIDLAEPTGGAGESRLIYAFTFGPGDDPASRGMRATFIAEFANPTNNGRDAAFWARRWHTLSGKLTDDGAAYRGQVLQLYDEIRDCTLPGCSLSQLRTNEIEFDWLWELREYRLKGTELSLSEVDKTPRREDNGSQALASFIRSNEAAIKTTSHRLPPALAGFASSPTDQWRAPDLSEDLRHAFAKETCDGCHKTENPSLDVNFHVSPLRKGVESLSPFLVGTESTPGELARRETIYRKYLCN